MNQPTPAIVTATAARPLARWVLVLLCLAYVVPGFVARDPWRNTDSASFGYILALAQGHSDWLTPTLVGLPASHEGLLAYWLGALAVQWAPAGWPLDMAARLPFMALLGLTLCALWWGTYYLVQSRSAQPVAFAFGGEAHPLDYARVLADSALLALMACLGLAQLAHEISNQLVQLACTATLFLAAAALPYRPWVSAVAMPLGLAGLTLSGAPALAVILSVGAVWLLYRSSERTWQQGYAWAWLATLLASAILAALLGLWAWRIDWPYDLGNYFLIQARMLVWFGWPAWPLALWTLWHWRRQIMSHPLQPHMWLPLWFTLVTTVAALVTSPSDRALFLALPTLAVLAALALPTLQRSVAALIDWFTLLFFSICVIAIWVIWLSVQTGIPAQPAANIARLAPGFSYTHSPWALVTALAATLAWCALVGWRTARHRAPLWKSLVLPASGTTLAWLLLMTLWMPMLNYARSDAPQVRQVVAALGAEPGCVLTHGLGDSQMTALQYHGALTLYADTSVPLPDCDWLATTSQTPALPATLHPAGKWLLYAAIGRPTNRHERILLLRRVD